MGSDEARSTFAVTAVPLMLVVYSVLMMEELDAGDLHLRSDSNRIKTLLSNATMYLHGLTANVSDPLYTLL